MEPRDVERILRDLLDTQGIRASIAQIQQVTTGWLVTITDQAGRRLGTRVGDGPPAAIRAALREWLQATDV
jgi:hypothetical protein